MGAWKTIRKKRKIRVGRLITLIAAAAIVIAVICIATVQIVKIVYDRADAAKNSTAINSAEAGKNAAAAEQNSTSPPGQTTAVKNAAASGKNTTAAEQNKKSSPDLQTINRTTHERNAITTTTAAVVATTGADASRTRPAQDSAEATDEASDQAIDTPLAINPEGMTIKTRFNTPEGYSRIPAGENSFARYLRDLPLKKDGEPVLYYDGTENGGGHFAAVVDQRIPDRDLHQCADAIMRLRAQYLYGQGRYGEIAFHFVDGFLCDYASWRAGKRVKFRNGAPYWEKTAEPDAGEAKFQAYLEIVYAYASTLSLEKELIAADTDDMQIGDVFIRGGSPGHAVIVVDMAESESGARLFMLAQSFMPAQQTHILRNWDNEAISPWYPVGFGERLSTPQYPFTRDQLKRFP